MVTRCHRAIAEWIDDAREGIEDIASLSLSLSLSVCVCVCVSVHLNGVRKAKLRGIRSRKYTSGRFIKDLDDDTDFSSWEP